MSNTNAGPSQPPLSPPLTPREGGEGARVVPACREVCDDYDRCTGYGKCCVRPTSSPSADAVAWQHVRFSISPDKPGVDGAALWRAIVVAVMNVVCGLLWSELVLVAADIWGNNRYAGKDLTIWHWGVFHESAQHLVAGMRSGWAMLGMMERMGWC